MKRLLVVLWLVAIVASPGCGAPARPPDLPVAYDTTSLGVGDIFELRIVGEDKLPTTYKVASDGTVMLPYIKRIHVAGLEPQQVEDAIVEKLKADGILTNPVASVNVREYNSKRVEVLGEVQKSGSLPLEPKMTLLRAISQAGGFSAMANKERVVVRRTQRDGSVKAAEVNVQAIMDNVIADIPLQAGDSIDVKQRIAF